MIKMETKIKVYEVSEEVTRVEEDKERIIFELMDGKNVDDKRRIPYNIWINVLGAIIFLLIASVGAFVFSIGLNADQVAVTSKEKCYGCWVKYNYKYDYDIETRSNWRDTFSRGLIEIVGIVIMIFGAFRWEYYVDKHYWHKGKKCNIK